MTNDGTRGDAVLNTLKVDMARVKFWMNGVDKDMCQRIEFDEAELRRKLNIGKETKILLMLSRLENWKRVDRALTALPPVIQKHNEALLIIIGDGPERCRLEKLVDRLQIRANVQFLGALPHEEIWQYLKIADIFLSLYDLSNMGNPLLEAMSCGKCIITLNTGDTSQLIHHKENGVLLELGELPHLPQVICGLLEDAKLRQRLGQKAREFALEHFWTWDERMEEEISTVERIIKARRPGTR
jgi:glycosyltransferase involved in cell wall biosynthesis